MEPKHPKDEEILARVTQERREFLKKVLIGTAFAIPVVQSFSLDELKIKMPTVSACVAI